MSQSPRVLVVEDHEPLRRIFVQLLERAGFRAYSAGSVDEAVSLASSLAFDAAVVDYWLGPGQPSGAEFVRRLKRQREPWSRTPCVGLTCCTLPEAGREFERAGAVRHVPKPLHDVSLVEVLREMLAVAARAA